MLVVEPTMVVAYQLLAAVHHLSCLKWDCVAGVKILSVHGVTAHMSIAVECVLCHCVHGCGSRGLQRIPGLERRPTLAMSQLLEPIGLIICWRQDQAQVP